MLPPKLMRDRDRWISYSETKVPLQVSGRPASSTNPGTWSSFDVVAASCERRGFVLNGDGIACIDLDHCFVDGVLEPWAVELLARVPQTFVEVSPSGDGLHVWGLAHVGQGRRMGLVEVYDRGRYMTVTGRPFGGFPRRLVDMQGLVDALIS